MYELSVHGVYLSFDSLLNIEHFPFLDHARIASVTGEPGKAPGSGLSSGTPDESRLR
jgi:hypothetical protein